MKHQRKRQASHRLLPVPSQDIKLTSEDGSVSADFSLTWECPNCGQTFFGEQPPDLCDYCQDYTTWRQRRP